LAKELDRVCRFADTPETLAGRLKARSDIVRLGYIIEQHMINKDMPKAQARFGCLFKPVDV
jgi:hypothetical protein